MANNDLEYQLRLEIKEQLSKVTKANSPNVYNAIHNSNGSLNLQGYARLEVKLVRKIVAGQLTTAAAVPQLEQELDLM
jgi:hypothetical protein